MVIDLEHIRAERKRCEKRRHGYGMTAIFYDEYLELLELAEEGLLERPCEEHGIELRRCGCAL